MPQIIISAALVIGSIFVIYNLFVQQWGLAPTIHWLDALLLRLLARKSVFCQVFILCLWVYVSLVSMHWGLSQNPTILEAFLPLDVFKWFAIALFFVLIALTVALIPAGIYSLFFEGRLRAKTRSVS